MEDAFTGLRPVNGPGGSSDPVLRWRQEWERGVAAAEEQHGGNGRLAANRRDYGSYLFVALDLILAVVIQFLLAIPLFVLTAVLFMVTGHRLIVGGGANQELMTWVQAPAFTLVGLFVTDGGMLLVLWYRLARQKVSWSAIGFDIRSWRVWDGLFHAEEGRVSGAQAILIGLAIGIVGLFVSSLLGSFLQQHHLDQHGQDKLLIEPLKHAPAWIVLGMVVAGTFVAPVVEELFFRGYIFRAIAIRKGVPAAYIISAGSFALFHVLGGSDIAPLVPVLFTIGLLLCFAYRRTGNLLTDITAHVFNNGAAFALALFIHF